MTQIVEIKRVRRNKTARELADKFGISPRTVRRLVAEERETYERRAQETRERIIELKRQGLKQVAIAQQLGVTTGLVSIRLKEAREAGIDLTVTTDTTTSPERAIA